MRWAITGGCGFIGLSLLRRLRREPETSVRLIDSLVVGTRGDLENVAPWSEVAPDAAWGGDGEVQLVIGDIRDATCMDAAIKGADVVVHLAACTGVIPSVEDPLEDCMVNVIGTANCLDAARRGSARRFIFASSGAPLGECEPPLHEDVPARPVSPYGASKTAGEAYCSAFHRTYGLGTVALRFGNVYGPSSHRKQSVVAKFIKRALDGKDLVIYGDGAQTRDYLYVQDLVKCILAAARAEVGGELFHVATNVETPLNELVEMLRGQLEPHCGPLKVVHEPARAGEVLRSRAEAAKAERMLGWKATCSLAAGLGETAKWFVENEESWRG